MPSLRRAKTKKQRRYILAAREAAKWHEHVFWRDGWACVYCESRTRRFVLEHRRPVSRKGKSTPDNLACACYLCDEIKGDMLDSEFVALPRCKPGETPKRGMRRP